MHNPEKILKVAAVMLLLSVVISFSLFAGGQKESAGTAKGDQLVVGVSLPTQSVERWVRDKNYLQEAGEKRGVKVLVQIANDDAGKQISQCENLIAQGVDVLIIAPHDAESAATAVKAAKEAGIPVFSYVRLILNADLDAHVADDFEKTGEVQGKYLADNVPSGNYVLLHGAKEDFNSVLFFRGAMKHLQPLIDEGKVNVVMDQTAEGWDPQNAMNIVENALTAADNEIDAILSPNDGLAGGAIQALAAQGLAGDVAVTGGDAGLDAAKRIVAGTQSMTVYRDIKSLAEKGIEIAIRLAEGKDISDIATSTIDNGYKDVPLVSGDAILVTKENIDSVLIDSGYHSREDVYGE